MRRLVSALVVLLGSASICYSQVTDKESPEAKVLDQWSGSWKVEVEVAPGEWAPRPGKYQETKDGKWILKGRFLEEAIKNPHSDARNIMGYDQQRRVYRSWFFNADGVTGEWTGVWNENSRTMNWTSDIGSGIDAKAWTRFNNADNYDFELTIKGPDEAVLMHIKATHTRAKE
jgi:hypothetical protein